MTARAILNHKFIVVVILQFCWWLCCRVGHKLWAHLPEGDCSLFS